MKRTLQWIATMLVLAITITTVYAFTREKASEKESIPIQSSLHQYIGPNGGGSEEQWKDPVNWPAIGSPITCSGFGQACMLNLPSGQTLQNFLDSQSSYSTLVSNPNVTQRN